MKYYPKLICTLLLAVVFSNTVLAQQPTFKVPGVMNVVSYTEFKPVSYGEGQGYEGDILRAIAELWEVSIVFHEEAVYEGIWLSPERSYSIADIAMGGMSTVQYRIDQGAAFSDSTQRFDQSLLVRKADYQSGKITSYASFREPGLKIGVVPGTTGEWYAIVRAHEALLPEGVLTPYPNETMLLAALEKGEIDAIARGSIGNDYQASIDSNYVTIDRRDFCESFSYAVDPANSALLQSLNEAIDIITDQGKIGYTHWLQDPHVFHKRAKALKRSGDEHPIN